MLACNWRDVRFGMQVSGIIVEMEVEPLYYRAAEGDFMETNFCIPYKSSEGALEVPTSFSEVELLVGQ